MTEQRKSRKLVSSRDALRILLSVLPLPFALSLSLFPELGNLQLLPIVLVFAFGAAIGTITHTYWLGVLIREQEFYKRFYAETALKPLKNPMDLQKKHTKILIPFYIFGALMFVILVFIFGVFDLSFAYALPFILGAMQGVPISYHLVLRGVL